MIRTDEKNGIKTGIEYVDNIQNINAVVTRNFSDWPVAPCNYNPTSVWLKLLRKKEYVEIKYAMDNINYQLLRLAYFPPDVQVKTGVVAAAPGKQKFTVDFEDFEVSAV